MQHITGGGAPDSQAVAARCNFSVAVQRLLKHVRRLINIRTSGEEMVSAGRNQGTAIDNGLSDRCLLFSCPQRRAASRLCEDSASPKSPSLEVPHTVIVTLGSWRPDALNPPLGDAKRGEPTTLYIAGLLV